MAKTISQSSGFSVGGSNRFTTDSTKTTSNLYTCPSTERVNYVGVYLTSADPDGHNGNTSNKGVARYSTSGTAYLKCEVLIGSNAYEVTAHNDGTVFNVSGGTATWKTTTTDSKYLTFYCSFSDTAMTNGQIKIRLTGTNCYLYSVAPWIYITTIAIPTATMIYPAAASKVTYNSKPYFSMSGTGDSALKYQYKLDSGSWTNVATSVNSGTSKSWQPSTALSTGSHTLYIRVNDGEANSAQVSRAFTYTSPSQVSAGNPIRRANMTTLKTYIDNLSAYYGTGSSTTITAPTQYDKIQDTDWTNYASKANATPHISSLAKPSNNSKATADYYNSYITKLKNG